MGTQTVPRVGWLANIGCALGVLSLGCIAAAFIYPFVTTIDKHGLEAPLAIGFAIVFLALISWLIGLAGLVVSLIALRRNMKGGGKNTSRWIAISGLVLGGFGVMIVCVLLAYIFLFNSSTPPPIMITPSSIYSITNWRISKQ